MLGFGMKARCGQRVGEEGTLGWSSTKELVFPWIFIVYLPSSVKPSCLAPLISSMIPVKRDRIVLWRGLDWRGLVAKRTKKSGDRNPSCALIRTLGAVNGGKFGAMRRS
ncbi:hypothetical protein U1Q18_040999 [Sarracenia purpurea var. burkii]